MDARRMTPDTNPPRRLRTRFIRAVVLAAISAALLPACASSSKPASTSADDRPNYIEDYTAGNYAAAYAGASAAARNTSLPEPTRQRATLIAGEAAYAMDRSADAQTWLFKVSGSQDPLVKGKAQATLGLIAMDDGNMARAAELLDDAAGSLMGDEAARSAMYAGDAYRAQNREPDATRCYRHASELARADSELKSDIADRLAGRGPSPNATGKPAGATPGKGGYTLQLAAFSSPQKAQQHAAKVRPQASRLKLGAPQVVPVFRTGKLLYTVRLGAFASKLDAQRNVASFPGAIVATGT